MGDNGILGKANEAVIQTNLGKVKEAYNMYQTENYELSKKDFTKLLKKVPVGEEGEYVYVIQDLSELKLDNLGEYGIGEIPESVSAITEFNNLYIVDESNNVSYVLEGKIYGTVELAKDTEPEESEEDKELAKFFTFNEETGAITGIVENTTKDADETFQNCKNLKKINFDENNKIII